MPALEITFDARELVALGNQLAAARPTFADEVYAANLEASRLVIDSARRNLQRNDSIDTKRLYNSVGGRVSASRFTVGSPEEHASHVEYGRDPGKMPPHRPIADWAARHGMSPGAVYPIRLKIARYGIPAKPWLEPAVRKNIRRINKFYADANISTAKRVTTRGGAVRTASRGNIVRTVR